MSRKPRKISESGLYHVVNRGLGKQIIFESDMDYKVFLNMVSRAIKETGISMLAFCLMSNHFHFVIYDEDGILSKFMQKIQERYAKYYNNKYMRKGYVFQGRFFSECIQNERYLISAISYVHLNPEKAGICKYDKYKYSSFSRFTKEYDNIIDIKILRSFIDDIEDIYYINHLEEENSMSEFENKHMTDIDGRIFIHEVLKLSKGTEIRDFSKNKRDKYLIILKNYGLSIRQIERLTGVGRGIIQDVIKT